MAHADSHPLGSTPARFELLPRAIRVAVGGSPAIEPTLVSPPDAPDSEHAPTPEELHRPPLATPTA
jgi:hypothetical protein